MVDEKFKDEIEIYHADYNSKSVPNTKMAVHQWDFTHFMTEKEIKALKEEQRPEKFTAPKALDLDTATRVVTTKADVKRMQDE